MLRLARRGCLGGVRIAEVSTRCGVTELANTLLARDIQANQVGFRDIYVEFHTSLRNRSAETVLQVDPGAGPTGEVGPFSTTDRRTKSYREPLGTYLQQYGRDLTQDAENGLLDPLVGRQDVLERVLQILLRRNKNNPCLIGDPGVGKTQIAEGVAQLIVSEECPRALKGCSLVALDVGGLVSGTQYRGTFEEKIQGLLKEVRRSQGRILLFVDEIHMLMDTGKTEGGLNAANLLKPSLARGELHMIGATTVHEYHKYVETDAAFSRRLQPVMVQAPTPVECLTWLQGLRKQYEEHHGVKFTDEALTTAISAAERFISNRKLPDSAIDLLDEAASRIQLKAGAQGILVNNRMNSTMDIKRNQRQVSENALSCPHCGTVAPLVSNKQLQIICSKCRYRFLPIPQEKLILGSSLFLHKDEGLIQYAEEEKGTRENGTEPRAMIPMVTRGDILHVAASASGLQVNKVETVLSESKAINQLSKDLTEHIVGQGEAIKETINSLRLGTMLASSGKRTRPISMMIFRGDVGVGKKTTGRIISESLFGSETAFLSFDMSQYNDRTAMSKLVGAAPGFIGYGDGGALTEAIRRSTHTVVFLENIERCHTDVVALIRQIAHQGYIHDGMGQKIDFRNTIIILTTTKHLYPRHHGSTENMYREETDGTNDLSDGGNQSSSLLELSESDKPPKHGRNASDAFVLSELQSHIDRLIEFKQLSESELREICFREIDSTGQILALCGIRSISVDPEVVEYLFKKYKVRHGHDAISVVESYIIDPIAEAFTSSGIDQSTDSADIHVSLHGGDSRGHQRVCVDIHRSMS